MVVITGGGIGDAVQAILQKCNHRIICFANNAGNGYDALFQKRSSSRATDTAADQCIRTALVHQLAHGLMARTRCGDNDCADHSIRGDVIQLDVLCMAKMLTNISSLVIICRSNSHVLVPPIKQWNFSTQPGFVKGWKENFLSTQSGSTHWLCI
jgi:hypothetical protein